MDRRPADPGADLGLLRRRPLGEPNVDQRPARDQRLHRRSTAARAGLHTTCATTARRPAAAGSTPASCLRKTTTARAVAVPATPISLGWGFAWPANRRMLYNRASADPDGKPWSERKRWIWWDESKGLDRLRNARLPPRQAPELPVRRRVRGASTPTPATRRS